MRCEATLLPRLVLLTLLVASTLLISLVATFENPSTTESYIWPSFRHSEHTATTSHTSPHRQLLQVVPGDTRSAYQRHVDELTHRKLETPWYRQAEDILAAFSDGWKNALGRDAGKPAPAALPRMGTFGTVLGSGGRNTFAYYAEPPPAPQSHRERKHERRHPKPVGSFEWARHQLHQAVPQTVIALDEAFADVQLPVMASISHEIEVREKMDADRTEHWRRAQLHLPFFDMPRLVHAEVFESPMEYIFMDKFLKKAPLASANQDFPLSLSHKSHIGTADLQQAGEIVGSFKEMLHQLCSAEMMLVLANVFNIPATWMKLVKPSVFLFGLSDAADARVRADPKDVLLTIEVFLSPTLGDTSKTLMPTTNKLPNRHVLEDPGHL
eukprot:CAMPEP_0198200212 /NCGR_PEP_ID=MMETSP1445-20131203/3259_1 /TAXON_ID=36898 /ORGANISM="Pyramimonas sp., Strain CCMP2087" /LENGTH=382 /DNA_ID=CAMNT_0043870199 /DNA_START=155 /DNA_END=1299 /DNA_ORIENTATION=-